MTAQSSSSKAMLQWHQAKNTSLCRLYFHLCSSVCLCLSGFVLPRVGCHRGEEEEVETESYHRPARHCGLWRWGTCTQTHTNTHTLPVVSAARWNIWVEILSNHSQCVMAACQRLVVSLVCGVTLWKQQLCICLLSGRQSKCCIFSCIQNLWLSLRSWFINAMML